MSHVLILNWMDSFWQEVTLEHEGDFSQPRTEL